MLQEKILQELEQIPPAKLAELYELIHYYRIGLQQDQQQNPTLALAGTWADMPDDVFQSLIGDIGNRRNRAFLHRRKHESSAD